MKKKARVARVGVNQLSARRRELVRRLWKIVGDDLAVVAAFIELLEYVERCAVTRTG